jgi:hypothetical protein
LSIQAYRVIAYTRNGEIFQPHRLDIYLHKSEADKRRRSLETALLGYYWFSRCEIRTVRVEQIPNQHVVGAGAVGQTVWNIRGRGRQIYGQVTLRAGECLTVWYNPEVRKWYPAAVS